jgi:hypothetical protein
MKMIAYLEFFVAVFLVLAGGYWMRSASVFVLDLTKGITIPAKISYGDAQAMAAWKLRNRNSESSI